MFTLTVRQKAKYWHVTSLNPKRFRNVLKSSTNSYNFVLGIVSNEKCINNGLETRSESYNVNQQLGVGKLV